MGGKVAGTKMAHGLGEELQCLAVRSEVSQRINEV